MIIFQRIYSQTLRTLSKARLLAKNSIYRTICLQRVRYLGICQRKRTHTSLRSLQKLSQNQRHHRRDEAPQIPESTAKQGENSISLQYRGINGFRITNKCHEFWNILYPVDVEEFLQCRYNAGKCYAKQKGSLLTYIIYIYFCSLMEDTMIYSYY